MHTYAEQQAVGFAEWCEKDYTREDGVWFTIYPQDQNSYTTSDLYQLYLNQQNQK